MTGTRRRGGQPRRTRPAGRDRSPAPPSSATMTRRPDGGVLQRPLPRGPHERAGDAASTVALERHDVLVAGEAAEPHDAEVGDEQVAVERAEPPRPARLDEPRCAAARRRSKTSRLSRRSSGVSLPPTSADCSQSSSVASGAQSVCRPARPRRTAPTSWRGRRRPRRPSRARLQASVSPSGREKAIARCSRLRELLLEAGAPAVDLVAAHRPVDEEEVAPPERRVGLPCARPGGRRGRRWSSPAAPAGRDRWSGPARRCA